jgi:hypothetical protein
MDSDIRTTPGQWFLRPEVEAMYNRTAIKAFKTLVMGDAKIEEGYIFVRKPGSPLR